MLLSQISQSFIGEFLSADGKFVHETALGVHEGGHPFDII